MIFALLPFYAGSSFPLYFSISTSSLTFFTESFLPLPVPFFYALHEKNVQFLYLFSLSFTKKYYQIGKVLKCFFSLLYNRMTAICSVHVGQSRRPGLGEPYYLSEIKASELTQRIRIKIQSVKSLFVEGRKSAENLRKKSLIEVMTIYH